MEQTERNDQKKMEHQKEVMFTLAQEAGIEHAVWMPVEDLEFDHDLRKYCVQNLCGNYGKNYACPPDCGAPWQMEEKARKYQWALVLQNIYEMKDVMDEEEVRQIRKKHNQLTSRAMKAFRERDYKGLAIMAGPCAVCRVCKKTEGAACPFPEQSASCLSAYCIKAEKMAEHCGLTYWCGKNKVAFFSIYLIKESK